MYISEYVANDFAQKFLKGFRSGVIINPQSYGMLQVMAEHMDELYCIQMSKWIRDLKTSDVVDRSLIEKINFIDADPAKYRRFAEAGDAEVAVFNFCPKPSDSPRTIYFDFDEITPNPLDAIDALRENITSNIALILPDKIDRYSQGMLEKCHFYNVISFDTDSVKFALFGQLYDMGKKYLKENE